MLGADRFRTQSSMATDSSQRVIMGKAVLPFLAHLGSQGELAPASVVVVVVNIVQTSSPPETAWPIKTKFYAEPPWERGKESLYKLFMSHDQDDRHANIW